MKPILLIIVVLLTACSEFIRKDEPKDPVVATAYGKALRLSQVESIIPKNISHQDSATMARNHINNWVQEQILIYNAKENLSPEEQDFTRQLEEYRNSLLLYSYERKLISQNLDTIVNDNEIQDYYRLNREQFELKGNIVKFDYVKLPEKSRQLKDFRRFLKPGNEGDSLKLADHCQKYSTDYWLSRDWIFLQDLLDIMPLARPENEEFFLRRTTYAEAQDDQYVYLLRINDFKTMDSTPPLEFEKENIRNIILNSRKLDLIEKFRQKDIDKAIRNNEVIIFKEPVVQ